MGGPDGKTLGTWSWRTDLTECRISSYRPDLTQSISIFSFDHCDFPYFLLFFFSGDKICIGMSTYVAHFDRKVGISMATKLFQFTSWKEPSNPSKTDGFFLRCSRHPVRPSYGDFLNSFAIKGRAGPYVSYDKLLFHTTSGLSGSKSG